MPKKILVRQSDLILTKTNVHPCDARRPNHKEDCKRVEESSYHEELLRHFYNDPFLLHYLCMAIVLRMGLHLSTYIPLQNDFHAILVYLLMYPISEDEEGLV